MPIKIPPLHSVIAALLTVLMVSTIAAQDDLGEGELIFVRYDLENTFIELVVLDLATGEETVIDTDGLPVYDPVWSPDADRIAFFSSPTLDDPSDLYVMNVDGSGLQQLTDSVSDDYSPAWSPDGTQLVYVSENEVATNLFIIDIEGGEPQLLPVTEPFVEFPTWSPDGASIAYGGEDPDAGVNIFVLDIQSMISRQLTRYDYATAPQWSPDGRFIAFDADDGFGNNDIYIMSATGLLPRRLTTDPEFDYSVAWSPDSQRLSFTSERDGNAEIYIMDADGGNLQRVTDSPLEEIFAPWRPVVEED